MAEEFELPPHIIKKDGLYWNLHTKRWVGEYKIKAICNSYWFNRIDGNGEEKTENGTIAYHKKYDEIFYTETNDFQAEKKESFDLNKKHENDKPKKSNYTNRLIKIIKKEASEKNSIDKNTLKKAPVNLNKSEKHYRMLLKDIEKHNGDISVMMDHIINRVPENLPDTLKYNKSNLPVVIKYLTGEEITMKVTKIDLDHNYTHMLLFNGRRIMRFRFLPKSKKLAEIFHLATLGKYTFGQIGIKKPVIKCQIKFVS